jgi:hypothetical protein
MLVFHRVTTVVLDLVYFVFKCTQAGRFSPYTIVMVSPCIVPELVTMPPCTGVTMGSSEPGIGSDLLPM